MHSYATLAQIHALRSKKAEAADTTEDLKLIELGRQATERFENMDWMPSFVPRAETVYYDGAGDHIQDNGYYLRLHKPFLSVASVSVGGAVLATSAYQIYPRTNTPITSIRRVGATWLSGWSDLYDAIAVTGVTGYHSNYAKAWFDSDDTLQIAIDETATELSVGNAALNATNAYGLSPRFSPGQVIRIVNSSGESEHMTIIAVDTEEDTLRVERGVLGTTAVAHEIGRPIDTWQVQGDIVRATAYQVGLQYTKIGSFAQVAYDSMSSGRIETMPDDIAPESWHILNQYKQVRFYSV